MNTSDEILTVAEVNQRLPLVRLIARDAMAVQQELDDREERLEEIREQHLGTTQSADSAYGEVIAMVHSLEALEDDMDRLTTELAQVGATFADPADGLVEFCSSLSGDAIMLSWKFDEPEVIFWRGLSDEPKDRHRLRLEQAGESRAI